jgi:peptidoglycan/LPS O-acetylase OafA/YrhL
MKESRMMQSKQGRPATLWVVCAVALVFGLLTLKSGGLVLFTEGEFHQQAGSYVPFVVWFNFIAGFAYLVAGAGLWQRRRWGGWTAIGIAAATLLVFALLGLHIAEGGSYENRTLAAMTLRSAVWIIISIYAYWTLLRQPKG